MDAHAQILFLVAATVPVMFRATLLIPFAPALEIGKVHTVVNVLRTGTVVTANFSVIQKLTPPVHKLGVMGGGRVQLKTLEEKAREWFVHVTKQKVFLTMGAQTHILHIMKHLVIAKIAR